MLLIILFSRITIKPALHIFTYYMHLRLRVIAEKEIKYNFFTYSYARKIVLIVDGTSILFDGLSTIIYMKHFIYVRTLKY